MSKKCKAYSRLTSGVEPEGFKRGFHAGWDACKQAMEKLRDEQDHLLTIAYMSGVRDGKRAKK